MGDVRFCLSLLFDSALSEREAFLFSCRVIKNTRAKMRYPEMCGLGPGFRLMQFLLENLPIDLYAVFVQEQFIRNINLVTAQILL